jgi:hypothetical protein
VCVLICICLAVLADLFNEKLVFASASMWLVALSGMIGMSTWVHFQSQLSDDTASKMKYDMGGWMLVVGAFHTLHFETLPFAICFLISLLFFMRHLPKL